MEFRLAIFPFRSKYIGVALMVIALPFAYLYFWGGRPEVFTIPTFAFVTAYAETRYFVVAETNALDEIAALFFILGISLFSFSKEKDEKGHFEALRQQALVKALYLSIFTWTLSFVFVYGRAILIVNFSIFIVFLLAYNALFRIALRKDSR